jgi:hypothetical protein
MIVRIIHQKWNEKTKRPETINYFNEKFPGTRQEAHKAARIKYPLPHFTLGAIWNE